jgi:hypothetical protein
MITGAGCGMGAGCECGAPPSAWPTAARIQSIGHGHQRRCGREATIMTPLYACTLRIWTG